MVLGRPRLCPVITGIYGQPSAEQIENSDGEFTAGVATGLSGLQRTHNDHLAGTDGLEITVDNSAVQETPASSPEEFSRPATHEIHSPDT